MKRCYNIHYFKKGVVRVNIFSEVKEMLDEEILKDELNNLLVSNIKLMKKIKDLGIEKVNLINIGNSISLGVTDNKEIPLLDRNEKLESVASDNGVKLKKYVLARDSKFNNIHNWLQKNISTTEINILNAKMLNKDEKKLQELLRLNGFNVVIYNGYFKDLNTDLTILRFFLSQVELINRINNSNTQTMVTGVRNNPIANYQIKKTVKKYANARYLKPIEKTEGKYTDVDYVKHNHEIIKNIDQNFLFNEALIDIDRTLYLNGNVNEVIDKWVEILRNNNCDVKRFEDLLYTYYKENKKKFIKE